MGSVPYGETPASYAGSCHGRGQEGGPRSPEEGPHRNRPCGHSGLGPPASRAAGHKRLLLLSHLVWHSGSRGRWDSHSVS